MRSSSPAATLRPFAGKPASNRSVTPSASTMHAVRSSTSCPGRLVPRRPLLPDPRALKLYLARAAPNLRTRWSSSATRFHGLSERSRGNPADQCGTNTLSLDGAANGSPCTWSTESSNPPKSYAPRSPLRAGYPLRSIDPIW